MYSNSHKAQRRLLDDRRRLKRTPHSAERLIASQTSDKTKWHPSMARTLVPLRHHQARVRLWPYSSNLAISDRVGIETFNLFLHLGGSNKNPLTYVDNCLKAIALAGLRKGLDGNVFHQFRIYGSPNDPILDQDQQMLIKLGTPG